MNAVSKILTSEIDEKLMREDTAEMLRDQNIGISGIQGTLSLSRRASHLVKRAHQTFRPCISGAQPTH